MIQTAVFRGLQLPVCMNVYWCWASGIQIDGCLLCAGQDRKKNYQLPLHNISFIYFMYVSSGEAKHFGIMAGGPQLDALLDVMQRKWGLSHHLSQLAVSTLV